MELSLFIAAVPSAVVGLIIWWLKKRIERNEKENETRLKNQEQLILMMMQSTRANNVGIEAIARAVQRIPDAHCNGDMDDALKKMRKYAEEEKEFLLKRGIQFIFE